MRIMRINYVDIKILLWSLKTGSRSLLLNSFVSSVVSQVHERANTAEPNTDSTRNHVDRKLRSSTCEQCRFTRILIREIISSSYVHYLVRRVLIIDVLNDSRTIRESRSSLSTYSCRSLPRSILLRSSPAISD